MFENYGVLIIIVSAIAAVMFCRFFTPHPTYKAEVRVRLLAEARSRILTTLTEFPLFDNTRSYINSVCLQALLHQTDSNLDSDLDGLSIDTVEDAVRSFYTVLNNNTNKIQGTEGVEYYDPKELLFYL